MHAKACKATAATVIVALCACLLHGLNRIYAGEIGGEIAGKSGGNRGVFRGNRP